MVAVDERHAVEIQQQGIPTYAGVTPVVRNLIAETRFDLAVLAYFHVAEAWMSTIRRLSPTTRIVVDNFDLSFLRLGRQKFLQRDVRGDVGRLDPAHMREMQRELNVYAAADMVLAISEKEAALIDDLTGESGLAQTVPDGEDLQPSPIPFEQRRGIVFTATFLHPPNLDAAMYLCTMVSPLLEPQLAVNHPLYLVGDGLHLVDYRFANTSTSIRKVGWVPSAIPYLEQARVAVMPLPFGAGTKRKVIQALMVGTPAVASSIATEGLDLRDGEHLLIADDPAAFARAVTRLLQDADLWQRLSVQGQAYMRAIRSRERAREAFLLAVERVQQRRPKPGDQALRLALDGPQGTPVVAHVDQRVRKAVRELLPRGSTVLIAMHGQPLLVDVAGYEVQAFPADGREVVSSETAIREIERERSAGGEYLVIPKSALPWLRYYTGFQRFLKRSYRSVEEAEDASCLIYALQEPAAEAHRPNIDNLRLESLAASSGSQATR
jgi:glycosyltransferase involved in cell wall biosynthesis